MLLDELIKINKIVFGVGEPMISFIRPLPTNPMLLDGSNYENKFIFTGVRTHLVIKQLSTNRTSHICFDDYICLGDYPSLLGNDFEIIGLASQNSFVSGYVLQNDGTLNFTYEVKDYEVPLIRGIY